MKVYDFKVILEQEETGGYVITCPALPGCFSEGETIDDAFRNIKEAIELCVEDMEANGQNIPDESSSLVGSVVITK